MNTRFLPAGFIFQQNGPSAPIFGKTSRTRLIVVHCTVANFSAKANAFQTPMTGYVDYRVCGAILKRYHYQTVAPAYTENIDELKDVIWN